MKQSLFRSEAMEHLRQRLWGEVIIAQPTSFAVLTAFLVVATTAGLIYMGVGTFDRTETVSGFVAPTGGLAQVYAARGGFVAKVLVVEGDVVRKEQPLIEMSADTAGAGGPMAARLKAETQLRVQELDSQAALASARFQQEGDRTRARIRALGLELRQIGERLAGEHDLLRLAAENRTRVETLTNAGNATRQDLAVRRQQELTQQNAVRELERQQSSRESDLRDLEYQLAMLPSQRDDQLSQLRSARADLMKSLVELDLSQGYLLTAPMDGRVAALQANQGQAAVQNSPLVALVPDGAQIEAHLLIPSRSAGLIAVGQEVRLRIDAYPFQRFGMIDGKVTQIGRAVYRPGELLAPIQIQEPVYRVIVTPLTSGIYVYGETRALTPGMTLMADIVVDQGTFLDAILDPVRAIRRRV